MPRAFGFVVHHDVNSANEVEILTGDAGSGASDTTFVHGIVGNLVFDAVYWYQYDGWNRLVQVNEAGSLTEDDFDDAGFLIPPDPNDSNDPNGVVGDPVARFVYDGLGRLAFYSTHLNHSAPIDEHVNRHLYYDGARRVSEHRHTRLWGAPILDRWEELDYVWGPDYVDELAFVVHEERGVRYAIQDANYNLVGWLKAGSAVAAQYVYGPYGELRAADLRPTESEWPAMGVGHQGLFFIRFDGEPDDPPLAVGTQGLYYNRNRWYSPNLGRFIQRDVNETALPIITALAFNADMLHIRLGSFDGQTLYAGGMNLYEYVGSGPVNRRDAAGLWWLPELVVTAGESSYLRSEEGAYVTGMAALVFAMLGNAYTSMTWGVMGGMSASGLDTFMEGVSATMSGEYILGETLMVAAELAVFATETQHALKRIVALAKNLAYHANAYLGPGKNPNDPRNNSVLKEMRAWANEIKRLVESRLKGKTQKMLADWIDEVLRFLENPFGGGGFPPAPI
jgi:RHS repeat-associated protein